MVRLRDPRGDDYVYTSKSLRSVDCILPGTSLSLQWRYSPGWASSSFRSFLHPSRFRV